MGCPAAFRWSGRYNLFHGRRKATFQPRPTCYIPERDEQRASREEGSRSATRATRGRWLGALLHSAFGCSRVERDRGADRLLDFQALFLPIGAVLGMAGSIYLIVAKTRHI